MVAISSNILLYPEAWTEQSKRKNSDSTDSRNNSISCDDDIDEGSREQAELAVSEDEYPSEIVSPLDDASKLSGKPFFITNRQVVTYCISIQHLLLYWLL